MSNLTDDERRLLRHAVEDIAYRAGADLTITARDLRRVYAITERIIATRTGGTP